MNNLAVKLNRYMKTRPTPTQAAFLAAASDEVLFGGAVGGGKSEGLLMAALQDVDVPGYAGVIVRESFSALEEPGGLIERARRRLAGTDANYSAQEHTFHFPAPASLSFRPLKDVGDEEAFMGSEYQFIGIDELTTLREEHYRFLFSRRRRPAESSLRLRMRATAMPYGAGLAWVRRRFIGVPASSGRLFIPSRLEDNPYLDTASYDAGLRKQDPITYERMRYGNWHLKPDGAIFKASYLHYYRLSQGTYVLSDMVIPTASTRAFSTVDPAFSTSTSADYTVIATWAYVPERHLVLLLDIIRERMEGPDLIPRLREVNARFRPALIGIESGAAQLALVQEAQRSGLPVTDLVPDRDKVSRAWLAATKMKAKQILLPEQAPFLEAFEEELLTFPDSRHDDQVDALSYAAFVAAEMAAPSQEDFMVYLNLETFELQTEPYMTREEELAMRLDEGDYYSLR